MLRSWKAGMKTHLKWLGKRALRPRLSGVISYTQPEIRERDLASRQGRGALWHQAPHEPLRLTSLNSGTAARFWNPQPRLPATARLLHKVRIHERAAVRKTSRSCSVWHRPTSMSSVHPTEYTIRPVTVISSSFFFLFTLAFYYIIANGHVRHFCALHVNHKCHGN